MTTTQSTLADVLAHHGYQTLGSAIAHGVIYACLDCGSIGGIDPAADLGEYPNVEAARTATRDALDLRCCGTVVLL